MQLTFEKDGPAVARVADDKKVKVYVASGDGQETMEFAEKIEPVPYKRKNQRVGVYVVGAAGSGKSRFIAQCIKAMPKKKVLLFTTARDLDPVFDMDRVHKVDYMEDKETLYTLVPEDLAETICIFDDFDASMDPKVNKFMIMLINSVLENGRKLDIDVFAVSHNPRDYNRTRTLIMECDTFVVFPQTNRTATLKFLKEYYDDDKEFLSMIKNLKDGDKEGQFTYAYLRKNVPRYMVSNKSVRLLA